MRILFSFGTNSSHTCCTWQPANFPCHEKKKKLNASQNPKVYRHSMVWGKGLTTKIQSKLSLKAEGQKKHNYSNTFNLWLKQIDAVSTVHGVWLQPPSKSLRFFGAFLWKLPCWFVLYECHWLVVRSSYCSTTSLYWGGKNTQHQSFFKVRIAW